MKLGAVSLLTEGKVSVRVRRRRRRDIGLWDIVGLVGWIVDVGGDIMRL